MYRRAWWLVLCSRTYLWCNLAAGAVVLALIFVPWLGFVPGVAATVLADLAFGLLILLFRWAIKRLTPSERLAEIIGPS